MLVRMPRLVLIAALLVIAAGLVMLAVGACTVGVTWDEKTHVLMLDTFFERGWNVSPDALLPDGMPDPAYLWGVYVYGPVGELVAHLVAISLGQQAGSGIDLSAAAYAGRHIGIALMALAGVAAAGLTVRVITGSRRWGVLGAAMLAATPLWIGHGMFNIKDTPVAVGYAIATLGVVVLMRPGPTLRRYGSWLAALALVTGTVLAAGTRAASGVPIAGGVIGAAAVLWLVMGRRGSWRSASRTAGVRLLWGTSSLVVAYVILVAIYPKAFYNPVILTWQALVVSARFPFDEAVLTAGIWMDQPPPASYLPLWFGAQLPLLVLVGFAIAAVAWVIGLVKVLLRRTPVLDGPRMAMVAAVLMQAVALPGVAIVMKSNMYNGSRQFLFVVPAACVLAAVGVWLFIGWVARRWPKRSALPVLTWGLVCLGLLAPVVVSSRLMPYNYAFFNAAASVAPIDGNWSTDYWRASGAEMLRRVPASGEESCLYEQGGTAKALHPCSDEPMFAPFLTERGADALPARLPAGGYWGIRENLGDLSTPSGCTLFDQVSRPLWWQEIVLGEIWSCSR
jgi:hypothetical protein